MEIFEIKFQILKGKKKVNERLLPQPKLFPPLLPRSSLPIGIFGRRPFLTWICGWVAQLISWVAAFLLFFSLGFSHIHLQFSFSKKWWKKLHLRISPLEAINGNEKNLWSFTFNRLNMHESHIFNWAKFQRSEIQGCQFRINSISCLLGKAADKAFNEHFHSLQ